MSKGFGLLGKKLGMTQLFDKEGNVVPVTVLEAGPCFILEKKDFSDKGFISLKLGFDIVKKEKRLNKPQRGYFKKLGLPPLSFVKEIRVDRKMLEKIKEMKELTVEIFRPGDFVDVTGISKGRGFAGVVKRWGFKGAPASHGTHEYFRHPGSIGQHTFPARVMKGKKMPGHMGAKTVTVQNLEVFDVRADRNLLLVKGAVPGPVNGYLIIKRAVKKYS